MVVLGWRPIWQGEVVVHGSLLSVEDSLAERSKAPDSSSGGAIRVGSNPTAVTFSATGGQDKVCYSLSAKQTGTNAALV